MRKMILFVFAYWLLISQPALAQENSPAVKITPANAGQVELLHIQGRGRLISAQWSSKGTIAALSSVGIWIYAGLEDENPRWLKGDYRCLAFSPDGSQLAAYTILNATVAPAAQIHIYDTQTWEAAHQIDYLPGQYNDVAVNEMIFAADNQTLYTFSSELRQYDLENTETVSFTMLHNGHWSIRDGDLNTDGQQVAITGPDGLYIFDAQTGQLLHSILPTTPHSFGSDAVTISRDGHILAFNTFDYSTQSSEIVLWDIVTKTEIARMKQPPDTGFIEMLGFSPDDRFLVTSSDRAGQIHLWDISQKQIRFQFEDTLLPARFVPGITETTFTFSPNGSKLLTTSQRSRLLVWDIDTGTLAHELAPYQYGASSSQSVSAVLPTNHQIALLYPLGFSHNDDTVWQLRYWDADTEQITQMQNLTTCCIIGEIWQSQDYLFAVGLNGIDVWDTYGTFMTSLPSYSFYVTGTLSQDAHTFATIDCLELGAFAECASPDDWAVNIYDTTTLKLINNWQVTLSDTRGLALSPDGTRILIRDLSGSVSVWNVHSGTQIADQRQYCEERDWFDQAAKFVDSSTVVVTGTACSKYPVRLWNYETNTERIVFEGRGTPIVSIAVSPDGQLLAIQSDQLFIVEIATGRVLKQLDTGGNFVRFSPDGALLFSGDEQIYVWGLAEN
ncbi:MAG TPA: WD40 repeat domain-containing protein [Phototrophicaceae bacterium]|nr:WD40 repeat domain-containing protein [Phototrophicaceae bacterium]